MSRNDLESYYPSTLLLRALLQELANIHIITILSLYGDMLL